MTVLASLEGEIAVGADWSASLPGFVEVVDDSPFYVELTVDARAAVAAAQRFQRLGVRVDGDRGDGVMVTFPDREVGNALQIEESSEFFGDRLTFRLVGSRFSPFARAWIRSRQRVDVYLTYGSALHEYLSHVFTGWIVQATYDIQPPAANLTCLDAAGLYAERRAKDYSLPPDSRKSRLVIGLELLAIGGIPVGSLGIPGGGGLVSKPVVPGDRPILDFLRDFYAILGVEIGFERGLFVANAFDPDLPAVAELNPGNLLVPLSLSMPSTLDANVSGVVAVSFAMSEPGGLRTEETSVIVTGPYAPATSTGFLASEVRVISEILTRTTYFGSLDIRMEQTEKGWYAVRAAGLQIQDSVDPPGYEIVARVGGGYIEWSDGTTRATTSEHFRRIRKTIRTKELDAENNVVRVREEKYFFHFLRQALWQVSAGEDVARWTTSFPVNDEGEGVLGGREVMGLLVNDIGPGMEGGLPSSSVWHRPDALTVTDYRLNDDGTIGEEVTVEDFYDIGQPRGRVTGAYGYGVDARTYTNLPAETHDAGGFPWGGRRTTTRRYRTIDADHYEVTEIVAEGERPATVTTSRLTGALPRPERAEPTTASQEVRAMVNDRTRIAFAGGEEIEDVEHNEFVESNAEARTYAMHRARKASRLTLNCEMPIEGLVHKWRAVTVNLPGASIHGLKFFVRSVTRNAATFRQAVVADYFPPLV